MPRYKVNLQIPVTSLYGRLSQPHNVRDKKKCIRNNKNRKTLSREVTRIARDLCDGDDRTSLGTVSNSE